MNTIINKIKKWIEEKQQQLDQEKAILERQLSELESSQEEQFNILHPVKSAKGKLDRKKEIDDLKRKISTIENRKKNVRQAPMLAGVFAFLILMMVIPGISLSSRAHSSSSAQQTSASSDTKEAAAPENDNTDTTIDSAAESTTVTTTEALIADSGSDQSEQTEATTENTKTEVPETTSSKEKSSSVSYSTNTKDTVKNGDSGIYAYKSRGGTYENYYIIDFDEGYVYFFSDGNGNDIADRVKIDYGTLNDVAVITYHDSDGSSWSYGLYFKYKNQPDHLILQDEDGFEYDFYTTNLKDAQRILHTKEISNY